MKDIPKIQLVTQSTPKQMKAAAQIVREFSDMIERGQVQGFCYAAFHNGNLSVDYVKLEMITMFDMLGSAYHLANYIQNEINQEEQ